MKNKYWENCPYFESHECPHPEAISRVYLLPQLLEPSMIEATKELCRICGKYLDEKRKHPRVKRPFQILLRKGKETAIEGDIINISAGGALIKLQDWYDFEKNEKVSLEIYPVHAASEKMSTSKIKVIGLISRIEDRKQQLAIIFLEETD